MTDDNYGPTESALFHMASTSRDNDDVKEENLLHFEDEIENEEENFELNESLRVMQLEEEQERLNNSLFSLSSHFAQVQLRIKQMNEAPVEEREKLLTALQDFAFKGCANIEEFKKIQKTSESDHGSFESQKQRQNELLKQLRNQVEDLENLAYENGEGDMPSTLILTKQKAILDKLSEKIKLNLDMNTMSPIELQMHVDEAIKMMLNPFKEQSQLVDQLSTQIQDLERFVNYLQSDNASSSNDTSPMKAFGSSIASDKKKSIFNFNLSNNSFQKNQLKATIAGNHYGDQRAYLQLAILDTENILKKHTLLSIENEQFNQKDNSETYDIFQISQEEIVTVVRKKLCPALQGLLEHGMLSEMYTPNRLFGLGCFKNNKKKPMDYDVKEKRLNHIWDVITLFLNSKNGKDNVDAPVRQLSQSFKLDNVGGRSLTSKQVLLTTIEHVISTHTKLNRSKDAQWKAFISAALNEKKLPAWLRIIFRSRNIVEGCYNSWSYVARTGCEELYSLLENFHKYNINLPVDLALRPFNQMKDAF